MCAGGVVSRGGGPAALPGELGSAGGVVSGWGLVGRDCGELAGVSILCVGWQLRQSQWGGMWCLCGIPEHLSV